MRPHLSENEISAHIAGEQSREVGDHLRDCPECAAQVAITRRSLLLFRDSGYQCAEYWQNQTKAASSRRHIRWAVAAVASAATIIAIVATHRVRKIPPTEEVFMKIPYVIPPAPYERTEVVRMDVPVAALIEAGFTMNAAASDSVPADVMVGQDGRPLAVAFLESKQ